MPLSDHERRVLDELEDQLHAADPKLASSLDGHALRRMVIGRRVKGAALFACGLAMMLVAIIVIPTMVGVLLTLSILGFLAMFAGSVYAIIGRPWPPAEPDQ